MRMRTQIYTVHLDPSAKNAYETAEFIREGFNFRAFVFGGLWALYHGLWLRALTIFLAQGLLLHARHIHSLTHIGFIVGSLGIEIIVGFGGNDWWRGKLTRKGYITSDVVAGDSLLRAELRYFDRYFGAPDSVSAGQ